MFDTVMLASVADGRKIERRQAVRTENSALLSKGRNKVKLNMWVSNRYDILLLMMPSSTKFA